MDAADISRLQDSIDRLTAAFDGMSGRVSGASSATSSTLRSLAGSFVGLKTASDAVEDSMKKLERRQLAYESLLSNTVRGLINLSNSAISTTQSFAAATGVFQSAAGGMNLFFNTVQGIADGLGKVAGHFNGLGTFINVAAKATAEALGLVNRALSFQLGAMQQQLDSYINVSKAGATFGGSLFYLQNAVQATGVPMREFVALVGRSADNLSAMGIGMTSATQAVIGFTKQELITDRALVGLYGSFNDLAAATAQYLALQGQLGRTDYSNTANQTAAIKEYLRNVKMLSEITGQTAEQQAAAERQRRARLGYASTIREAEAAGFKDAGTNLQLVTGIFGKMSPVLGDVAMQMVQGRDKLGAEQQRLISQFPVLSDVMEQLTQAAKTMSATEFKNFTKVLFENNRDAIDAEAKLAGDMYKDIYNRIDGPLKDIADAANSVIASFNTIANLSKILQPSTVGLTVEEQQAARGQADAINATIQSAMQQMLEGQQKIDVKIAEQFVEMTNLVKLGFKVQDLAVTATNIIIQGAEGVINKIMTPEPQQNGGTAIGNPMADLMATGGVTRGPTLVGEDGPEAVIPLAKGAVPMNIDWRPLVQILEQQVAQNDEMLRAMRDSRDAQERLLYTLA